MLFLVCLATLPAIVFTFLAAEHERSAMLARMERDAVHLARLASREHQHQLEGAQEILRWLSAKLAREGTQSQILTDADFLPALLAGHPQLANIGVLSPDGTVLSSAHPLPSYQSWSDNPAVVAALRSDDVEAGGYTISPIFERPTLNHAHAVRNGDRDVTAVLFTGLNLEWLSQMAQEIDLPEGFSVLITDRDGRLLAHGGEAHAELADGGEARIPAISELAQSRRGRMVDVAGTNQRRYLVAAPLQGAPDVYVAVGLPHERVVGEANAAFYRTLGVLGALTLFTIIVVFIATELGLLRGLRSLARTVKRFGGGELTVRARAPRGHDELASLAMAFNTMADSLAHRHREAVESEGRLRALARGLQEARETEAARISRELHDELGQVLTSLKIDLSRLSTHCATGQPELSRELRANMPCAAALEGGVEAMSHQIAVAVDFVRRVSADLRPGVLDTLGLATAIEWQAREIEARTDLAIQVEVEGIEPGLDKLLSVTLFRIAQEALTNVVRHAEASLVEIVLARSEDGTIVLTVSDDGRGIEAEALESGESLGIIGIRERVMLVNGHLSICGAPGQGTKLTVTVPPSTESEIADEDPVG